MLSLRLFTLALFAGVLLACDAKQELKPNQITVSFYPPQQSFPDAVKDQEALTQRRYFRTQSAATNSGYSHTSHQRSAAS